MRLAPTDALLLRMMSEAHHDGFRAWTARVLLAGVG
jgi:hypothetical protein